MDSIVSCLLNPVRMKILQLFLTHKTETVKRIGEELPDIPSASLYRHINKLVEDGILEVCAEYRIRGTVEKVYRLKENPLDKIKDRTQEPSKEELFGYFYAFTMALLSDYETYLTGKDQELRQDRVDFQSYPLYLSDEEYEDILRRIKDTLVKYEDNKADGERRLRKIFLVAIPGKSELS